jgi:ABC-type lipoprotein release transport system permease subunit
MKAIGAKNRYILSIFLLNSALIGLVGGIGGVILGFFISTTISSMSGLSSSSILPGRGAIGNFFSSTYVSGFSVWSFIVFSNNRSNCWFNSCIIGLQNLILLMH